MSPSSSSPPGNLRVTVLITVKNEVSNAAATLDALTSQTRRPDEIIIVDGGSTDGTIELVRRYAQAHPQVRLMEAPGANIARGRNLGTASATSEIIATTDCGCRAEPDWLENLIRPFEQEPETEFVAGVYKIDPQTLLEQVVGLATMRGQLDPPHPERFNPSARSMAYTKCLWSRAGGWPEWLCYSEDTLFDQKIRAVGAKWRFAGTAIVNWRPRRSFRAIARQFYNYGTGRGHTQIGADEFAYNLRNLLLMMVLAGLCVVTPWAFPLLLLSVAYFYVWSFHAKAVRIARRTGRVGAYPLCLIVTWVVLVSNLAGYLVGTWQRWRDQQRYGHRMRAYLPTEKAP